MNIPEPFLLDPDQPLVRNLTMTDFRRILNHAHLVYIRPTRWLFPYLLTMEHEIPVQILGLPCEVVPLLWGEAYTYAFLKVDVVLMGSENMGVISFEGKEGAAMMLSDNARLFTNYRLPISQQHQE